jgi:hypothetical protein
LARFTDGLEAAVTLAVDGGEVRVVPPGSLADAVAVLLTDPASMSACVTAYVAVHVTLAAGASDAAPAGQVTDDIVPVPENAPSVTPTPCIVTLPVLVTTNE